MTRQKRASKLYRYACILTVLFIAASASFQGFYQKWHFREPGVPGGVGERAGDTFDFVHVLNGTADRPYVYRQLLPATVTWIDAALPQSLRNWYFDKYGYSIRELDSTFISPISKDPAYFLRYQLFYYLDFFFAWLAAFAMYRVCRAVDIPTVQSVLASVSMMLVVPFMMSNGGYYYDYPELAFLALAVWMAIKCDWWWLIPVAALGAWNKESFLLAVLSLYPILRSRTSRRNALLGTAVLALTCVAVYLHLRTIYAHNPGGTVLIKWQTWIGFMMHPGKLFLTESTYGIKIFKAFSPIPILLLVWTVIRGWPRLPVPIRRHAIIAAAINFPLFFLFCSPGEMRDLSLLYIVLLLLFAVNMSSSAVAKIPAPASA